MIFTTVSHCLSFSLSSFSLSSLSSVSTITFEKKYRIGLKFGAPLKDFKGKDNFVNQPFFTNVFGFIHKKRVCKNQKFIFDLHIKCTILLPHFFPKFEAIFLKSDYLFMIQITVCRWALSSSIFLAIAAYHLKKTMRLLRRSTNRSIFLLFHKSGNADEPGRVP